MSNKHAIPLAACIALVLVVLFHRPPEMVEAAPPPTAAPILSAWETKKSCPLALCEAQGAAMGDLYYIFGGYYTTVPSYQGTVECHSYNPVTDTWASIANMPRAITHAGVAIGATKIFLAGGYPLLPTGWQSFACTDVNAFDPQTNRWIAYPSLPAAAEPAQQFWMGSVLHFMGGVNINRVDQITHWSIDLSKAPPVWKTLAALPSGRNHVAAVILNKKIYLIGGQQGTNDSNATDTMFVFDIVKGTWSAGPRLPKPRSHHADSTFVLNGQIIVAGGITTGTTPLADVNGFDPVGNRWYVITPSLPKPRHSPVVHYVNGRLVCSTGYYWPPGFQSTTWVTTVK